MSRKAALLVVAALVLTWVGGPAVALTSRWAGWGDVTGSANAFRTTLVQRSPGFPQATVASDSRSPVSIPGGTSAVLGTTTPPGAKYGTSLGSPYLLLRPKADTASTPSTTTYSFDAPTPDTGWAFVLGDIDSDAVQVGATDEDGVPVTAAEVASWFRGTFNYAGGDDEPTWSPTTNRLTGNPTATDTDGASGWFEPDIRLSSLTFTFTRRAGFPVYQTWFVSRARPIGGTITAPPTGPCNPMLSTVTLLSPFGERLADATPAENGSYSFGEVATQAGYVVRLDVPAGCAVDGPAEQTVSNQGEDGSDASLANFTERVIIPQPISGTVRDADGPVAGVVVTLTAPGGGSTKTTTTGADGTYLFDDNGIGTGYTISIGVPDGYVAGPDGATITGVAVAADPVAGQDFLLVDLPSVSGTVTGGGQGIGGVPLVLTATADGAQFTVVTAGDGTYEIDGLPPGDYTLEVVAPAGYDAPPIRTITVGPEDRTGEDFALERPGAVGGTITRDEAPVAGVEVVVDGPGGQQVVTTDADGRYFVDALPAGGYTTTVRPPTGSVVVGPATQSTVITAAGEIRGGLDFQLVAAPAPTGSPSPTPTTPAPTPTSTPTASPTASPTPSPTASPTAEPTDPTSDHDGGDDDSEVLPDTGGPSVWLGAGSAVLVAAGLALIAVSRRRTRHE